MNQRTRILIFSLSFVVAFSLLFGTWIYRLNKTIKDSLENRRFIPPIEFYSAPQQFHQGQKLRTSTLESHLRRHRYRRRSEGQILNPGDYVTWNQEECQKWLADAYPEGASTCVAYRNKQRGRAPTDLQVVALSGEDVIFDILRGNPPQRTTVAELEPELFAQFVGAEPMLKVNTDLGDAPPACLNAVLAIEDSNFLEHQGVSLRAIARAFVSNLSSFRVRQGGSTITQQLVKNYFLTHERTLRRKFKEFFMAILLEMHATKDEILQSYINEIYMGQNGPFQVRGFGSASEHYFGKELGTLNLPECALLAAVVNSPGLYNPFRNSDRALKRRELVLQQMAKQELISADQLSEALAYPLPKERPGILSEPAPYFVDAVQKQLDVLGVDRSRGVKVFTTMSLEAQEAAQDAVRRGVERLEKDNATVHKLLEQGKSLEGLLLSADPRTGFVTAIVGGRSFKKSQFNRATSGHRQVGSIIKPFVYLAALESQSNQGQGYNPLTLVQDEPVKIEYEGQKWEPSNYEKKYFGFVPMFFALQQSLNAATARVALDVGLEPLVELLKDFGVASNLKALPALSLGAFEMYPMEVLQSYVTLGQMGINRPLTYIVSAEDMDGEPLFVHKSSSESIADPGDVAVLVGMMKQIIESGTGRAVRAWGFQHPAAGKTGTTSDNKDAWFAGFTPLHAAVAWVGYDDNTSSGLTGASGAIPIWTDYMSHYASKFPPIDFDWPADLIEQREIDPIDLRALGVPEDPKRPLTAAPLIFKKAVE